MESMAASQDDVRQLATQCREVEKLLELPVGVVQGLLSGEEQSADLGTLMEWLVRAKELSSRNVLLADSLLGAGQQLNHDAKCACTDPLCVTQGMQEVLQLQPDNAAMRSACQHGEPYLC